MNALNSAVTALFNVLLYPLDLMGDVASMLIASGIFGVFALLVFKHISAQGAIKSAKDRIKGHLIEIRLYQDDLRVVAGAFCKIMLRNVQYLGLNFGPIVPLLLPFGLVMAQFVVRYAFAPVPVEAPAGDVLPGHGTMLHVKLTDDAKKRVAGLTVELPEGLVARSKLVRSEYEGRAWQEIAAVEPGVYEIGLVLSDGTRETKQFVAGREPARLMQPERGRGFWSAFLWPAEPTFAGDSPFERVHFVYPDRDLGWLPGGVGGVLIIFIVASMLFGALAMKPLKVQI